MTVIDSHTGHCDECEKRNVDVVEYAIGDMVIWFCMDCLVKGVEMLQTKRIKGLSLSPNPQTSGNSEGI